MECFCYLRNEPKGDRASQWRGVGAHDGINQELSRQAWKPLTDFLVVLVEFVVTRDVRSHGIKSRGDMHSTDAKCSTLSCDSETNPMTTSAPSLSAFVM